MGVQPLVLGKIGDAALDFTQSLAANLLASLGLSFGNGGAVSIIPWWLVLLAMVFSMMVGVVFGFIPANRAVKISALEAIRHD